MRVVGLRGTASVAGPPVWRGPARTLGVLLGLVVATAGLLPGSAVAAHLAGGRRQAAIRHAFLTARAARGQEIVSIRVSTVAPYWAIVRSVAAPPAGRTTSTTSPLALRSTYVHQVGGRQRIGSPPGAARADLSRPFRVAVTFAGSGGDAVVYNQQYESVCQGQGPFTDMGVITISPMSWTVRYIVDLDAVTGAAGRGADAAIVPTVAFSAGRSRVDADEQVIRQFVDQGCNGSPTTFRCHMTFRPGGAGSAGALSLAGGGLRVGVPVRATQTGSCDPADYTLGPSLWDSGGTTASVAQLGLLGGSLPANPYAPVTVAWPGSAAGAASGFVASPCAGDPTACSDSFHWHGTVRIEPVTG